MGVYLWTNELTCDFTQSDCGFTFYSKNNSSVTYGRDGNGLWVKGTGGQWGVAWTVPISIYSKGNIKKAVFTFNGGGVNNGGGFSTGFDTKRIRHYTGYRVFWGSQNSSLAENSPASEWTFTADLENKLLSSSISSNTLALTDSAISDFNTDRNAGNVHIHLVAYTANTYAYIKNITFYS